MSHPANGNVGPSAPPDLAGEAVGFSPRVLSQASGNIAYDHVPGMEMANYGYFPNVDRELLAKQAAVLADTGQGKVQLIGAQITALASFREAAKQSPAMAAPFRDIIQILGTGTEPNYDPVTLQSLAAAGVSEKIEQGTPNPEDTSVVRAMSIAQIPSIQALERLTPTEQQFHKDFIEAVVGEYVRHTARGDSVKAQAYETLLNNMGVVIYPPKTQESIHTESLINRPAVESDPPDTKHNQNKNPEKPAQSDQVTRTIDIETAARKVLLDAEAADPSSVTKTAKLKLGQHWPTKATAAIATAAALVQVVSGNQTNATATTPNQRFSPELASYLTSSPVTAIEKGDTTVKIAGNQPKTELPTSADTATAASSGTPAIITGELPLSASQLTAPAELDQTQPSIVTGNGEAVALGTQVNPDYTTFGSTQIVATAEATDPTIDPSQQDPQPQAPASQITVAQTSNIEATITPPIDPTAGQLSPDSAGSTEQIPTDDTPQTSASDPQAQTAPNTLTATVNTPLIVPSPSTTPSVTVPDPAGQAPSTPDTTQNSPSSAETSPIIPSTVDTDPTDAIVDTLQSLMKINAPSSQIFQIFSQSLQSQGYAPIADPTMPNAVSSLISTADSQIDNGSLTDSQLYDYQWAVLMAQAETTFPTTSGSSWADNDYQETFSGLSQTQKDFINIEVTNDYLPLLQQSNEGSGNYTDDQLKSIALWLAIVDAQTHSQTYMNGLIQQYGPPPPAPVPTTPAPSTPNTQSNQPPSAPNSNPSEVLTQKQEYIEAAQMMIERGGVWKYRGMALKYLINKGIDPILASGFVGNFIVESGVDPQRVQDGFDGGPRSTFIPDSIQGGRGGYGIVMWTSIGRLQGLQDFANNDPQGRPVDDFSLQMDYVWKELSNNYSSVLQQLQGVASPADAASIVMGHGGSGYENPDPNYAHEDWRRSNATTVYVAFSKNLNSIQKQQAGEHKHLTQKTINQIHNNLAHIAMQVLDPTKYQQTLRKLGQDKPGFNTKNYSGGKDCAEEVGDIINAANIDPSFPGASTVDQYNYMINSSKWQRVQNHGTIANLKKGDVFSIGRNKGYGANGHTFMYVGNGKVVASSMGDHGPELQNVYFYDSRNPGGKIDIFRFVGKNLPPY